MPKHSKRYDQAADKVEPLEFYDTDTALGLLKDSATAKFDETVELHIRLNVDPRQADQQVRGVVLLPHGLGKPVRVLVFAQGEGERLAIEADATFVGSDDLIERIEGGWVDFDVALATPDIMGRIGKLGRVLGRRGLMPSPRGNTVVQPQDLPRAIEEARKGRVEFRLDRTGIIHSPIGKASFDKENLKGNLAALVGAITQARPEVIRGQFIRSVSISSSMGPGINIDPNAAATLRPAD
jgi:large subunit ribosomal protein L1